MNKYKYIKINLKLEQRERESLARKMKRSNALLFSLLHGNKI